MTTRYMLAAVLAGCVIGGIAGAVGRVVFDYLEAS